MVLITFSGVDGCGKSTHATLTREYLERQGLRVAQVATLRLSVTGVQTILRERKQAIRKHDSMDNRHKTAQSQIRTYPGGRTFDQDRRRLSVRLRRVLAYPLDCIAMRIALGLMRWSGYDAVVCDRFTFDKLVALPKKTGALARVVQWITPKAHHAILLDTSPETAIARKREYQDDYYVTKCAEYRELVALNLGLTLVESTTVEQVQHRIEALIQPSINAHITCNQTAHKKIESAKAH